MKISKHLQRCANQYPACQVALIRHCIHCKTSCWVPLDGFTCSRISEGNKVFTGTKNSVNRWCSYQPSHHTVSHSAHTTNPGSTHRNSLKSSELQMQIESDRWAYGKCCFWCSRNHPHLLKVTASCYAISIKHLNWVLVKRLKTVMLNCCLLYWNSYIITILILLCARHYFNWHNGEHIKKSIQWIRIFSVRRSH